MQRLALVRPVLGLLAALTWFMAPGMASAQEEVQFETADKVELHGTFYAGGKAKAPCVILLHKTGGSRDAKGWKDLAQALNKDFAVLAFDFRGHGESTSVDVNSFWSAPNNSLIKGAAKKPGKISYKDFPPSYYPMFVYDVIAAKRYLDQQNDAGACNTSNVVVIGAEEGAAVGALWMATEFDRYKMVRNAIGRLVPDPSGKSEGEDIASAIWLSIPKTFAGVNVGHWLKGTGNKVRDKVPMVFFYGDQDSKAASAANALLNELKAAGRSKLEFTATRPKKTKLAGVDLLGKKNLNTEEDISTYLVERVMPKRGTKAWVMREVEKGPPTYPVPFSKFGIGGLR